MISGPLGRVRHALGGVENGVASLGMRMGNLALAMAPVALAAGVMLGAFGACVGVAAGFEDQMAKVGAVSRASSEEMAALEATARELGATTQFTAVQVGEAEQYLAMAGFSAKENIAALPGVLNLAAATATDLGLGGGHFLGHPGRVRYEGGGNDPRRGRAGPDLRHSQHKYGIAGRHYEIRRPGGP